MHFLRWQLRTLMGFIAIAALALTFQEMHRRAEYYRDQASYHLAASRQLADEDRGFLCGYGMTDRQVETKVAPQSAERRIAMEASKYHVRMFAKYQLAAERPWLSVKCADPPPPGSYPKLLSADDY
jgi:hypothetical protein